ncbi:MAG: trypsin-like peptidase domain-containing protein [Tannerellaceae bacterium]|jgi:tetratricopeptide (TPR) repeat protein|nr:trypsin-like peptidase domain-containing protein [Tannerellaceae bacterium]
MKSKLIIFLLAFCTAAFAEEAGLSPQRIKLISNSIFTVYTYGPDGQETGRGSGFIVGVNGLCVTNFHVLEDAYSAVVKLKTGEKIKVRHVADYDAEADLVKFQLDVPASRIFVPLGVAPTLPMQGEDIISISTPLGLYEQTLAKGNVSSVRKEKGYGHLIQVTAPLSRGSSGSPIINSQGQVVGIATMIVVSGQNLNFAVTALKLAQLNRNRKQRLFDMSKDPLETRYIKLARYALRQRNTRTAIKYVNTELGTNPQNHWAWRMLGDIYFMSNDFEKSMEYHKRAYNISDCTENVFSYGQSVSALGKQRGGDKQYFQLAYELLNKVATVKADPSIYYAIGDLIYEYSVTYSSIGTDKLKSALESLDYALYVYYRSPSKYNFAPDLVYIKRGEVKTAMNDVGSALVDYDNAIKIDPQYYKAYYLRGKLRAFNLDNPVAGLEDEEKALRLIGNSPQIKADILYTQAMIYHKLAYSTGNESFISSSVDKLGEAYKLTGNTDYMDYKQQIIDELNE